MLNRLAILLMLWTGGVSAADEPVDHTLRRPVAMVRLDGHLYVASRDTGSISVFATSGDTPVAEVRISERLDGLAAIPGTRQMLAVDSKSHQVLVVQPDADNVIHVTQTLRVSRYPLSVVVTDDGHTAAVPSLWSRRVTVLRTNLPVPTGGTATSDGTGTSETVTVSGVIDLPFPPGTICFLDRHHLLVLDAHGGDLAVIDTRTSRLNSWQRVPGHNLTGGALSADGLNVVLSHQIMNAASSTTRSIISWGGVISNTLHTIPVNDLLASKSLAEPEAVHGVLFPLGRERHAAGDPAGVAVAVDGRVYVALAGVNEVGLRMPGDTDLLRAAVGMRPTQLLLDEPGHRLYVLCSLDDSVHVLDSETLAVRRILRLSPATAVRSFEARGEELFYDARLSLDGWYSCHSCHTAGHSSGLLNDNFGDESFNTPKRILSLLGTADTEPWAWNGSQIDLRNQVRKSVEQTMAGPGSGHLELSDADVESLVAFIATLPPAPGIRTAREVADSPEVTRGRAAFLRHGCSQCHQPDRYMSPLSFDVGLHDEAGRRYFNPPSLRGVSQRGPFFHDNRAGTLLDVLLEQNHAGAAAMSESEARDVVEFLRTL